MSYTGYKTWTLTLKKASGQATLTLDYISPGRCLQEIALEVSKLKGRVYASPASREFLVNEFIKASRYYALHYIPLNHPHTIQLAKTLGISIDNLKNKCHTNKEPYNIETRDFYREFLNSNTPPPPGEANDQKANEGEKKCIIM